MNILFWGAEMAVDYAYPPLGMAIRGARYAKVAYDVGKAGMCFFSGDYLGGVTNLGYAANGAMDCEFKRDICVDACTRWGYDPIGSGACISGCWLGYKACVGMR